MRREFSSESEWREKSKNEFMNGLNDLLKKFNGELCVVIHGDATAETEFYIEEYVTVNAEERFFYQTIEIGYLNCR